jgi:pyruvate kinase
MNKLTKILATVGPASDSQECIENMIKAGVNVFRLNFSHGTHKYHKQTLGKIKKAMKKLDTVVGIFQDISGPKVRIGMLNETFNLKTGDEIRFQKDEIEGYTVSDNIYNVSINYPNLLDKVKLEEYIYLYDGTIRAKVIQTSPYISATIQNGGILSSKKGINFPNTVIDIDVITQKDKLDIAWGIKNKVDFFAI